jgi:hypothetical protein
MKRWLFLRNMKVGVAAAEAQMQDFFGPSSSPGIMM